MSSKLTFSGRQLKIATNISPPFVLISNVSNVSNKWYFTGGYEAKLIEELSVFFNFTYDLINCHKQWGTQLPNKSWNGIIGKIASNTADIGISDLTVTYDRSRAVEFLSPHFITRITFITSLPKTEQLITLVIKPFDLWVWIYFIITFAIMLFCNRLIFKCYPHLKKFDLNWDIICITLRQQFFTQLPYGFNLRIMYMCWLLSCFVLTSSYGGCLYSLMTIPPKLKTINTLEELAFAQKSGHIQVIGSETASHYISLKESKMGVKGEIGALIKPVKNTWEGLGLITNSNKAYAYIITRARVDFPHGLVKYNKKPFYLPPQTEESTLNMDVLSIAVNKNFEFKSQFNYFVSNVLKAGLMDYWRLKERKTISAFSHIEYDSALIVGNHEKSINLDQLQSAFYLYFIGLLSCLLFFAIELFIKFNHLIGLFVSELWHLLKSL